MEKPKIPKFFKLKKRLFRKKLKNMIIWALLIIISVFISYISVPYFKFDFKEGYTTIYVDKDIDDNNGVGRGLEAFYSVNPKLTKEINQIKFKKVPEILGEEGIWYLKQAGIYKKEYNNSLIYFYYDYSPDTVYHEIGHNVYYKHLTEEEREEWEKISKEPYPSRYAESDSREDIAVSFAIYLNYDECLYYIEYENNINETYYCYLSRGNLNKNRVDYLRNLDSRLNFRGIE